MLPSYISTPATLVAVITASILGFCGGRLSAPTSPTEPSGTVAADLAECRIANSDLTFKLNTCQARLQQCSNTAVKPTPSKADKTCPPPQTAECPPSVDPSALAQCQQNVRDLVQRLKNTSSADTRLQISPPPSIPQEQAPISADEARSFVSQYYSAMLSRDPSRVLSLWHNPAGNKVRLIKESVPNTQNVQVTRIEVQAINGNTATAVVDATVNGQNYPAMTFVLVKQGGQLKRIR